VRPSGEHEPQHHPVYGLSHAAAAGATAATAVNDGALSIQCSDARTETDQVEKLYKALTEAKKKAGESVTGNMESFASFVQKKTDQIRKQHGCQSVEYTVETQNGQVRLKAKAKA
jgi:hypothetical protein